jgi:hypothetical protein
MVKLPRREYALGVVALALLGILLYRQAGRGLPLPLLGDDGRPAAPIEEVPRIGLDRLKRSGPPADAGRRDLFAYGQERSSPGVREAEAAAPPPPAVARTPPPAEVAAGASVGGDSGTPLNVKYVGSVESRQGVRVAILLTDKKEILVGQQGDVVANRLRIVKIGYESVDVQDVGTEHVRRIPFKGN